MRKFILLVFITSSFSCVAQVKCDINQAFAYFTVSTPGIQMVDEKGNTVPTVPVVERFIYIEWTGTTDPTIESVLYNNRLFKPTIQKVAGITVLVGKNLEDETEINIQAKKNGSFWKIELQPITDMPQDIKVSKNIVIKIKNAGKTKTCMYKIPGKEFQLYAPPRY